MSIFFTLYRLASLSIFPPKILPIAKRNQHDMIVITKISFARRSLVLRRVSKHNPLRRLHKKERQHHHGKLISFWVLCTMFCELLKRSTTTSGARIQVIRGACPRILIVWTQADQVPWSNRCSLKSWGQQSPSLDPWQWIQNKQNKPNFMSWRWWGCSRTSFHRQCTRPHVVAPSCSFLWRRAEKNSCRSRRKYLEPRCSRRSLQWESYSHCGCVRRRVSRPSSIGSSR